jgi:hypothetical protein
MSGFARFFHEHDIFFAAGALWLAAAVPLVRWRPRPRWWAAWGAGGPALGLALFFGLRSPPATLTVGPDPGASDAAAAPALAGEFVPASVDDIRRRIASAGRPTLVEIFSDFGLS